MQMFASPAMVFLHTSDWQLGKPFAGIEDQEKRSLVRQERFAVIDRIGAVAREHGAEFVVVAGDLFDSPSVTKSTVSAACAAIGRLGVPVFVIPGNHDHGGAGSVWEQDFFRREQGQLAPNLQVLLAPSPVELENAVIFPCPLAHRHENADVTGWLRSPEPFAGDFGDRPRIVLAHGSVQTFGATADDEDPADSSVNLIDLSRIPADMFDYIALGDWHGARQINERAWYAGTPEFDRFPKGEDHAPGQVLIVAATRGQVPAVHPVATARFKWHRHAFVFTDDASLANLERQVDELIGNRANEDLLRLELAGSLGIEATTRLEQRIESWRARLLRLKLANRAVVAPSPEEMEALVRRPADPLIARVASALVARATTGGDDAAVASLALRELHAACRTG